MQTLHNRATKLEVLAPGQAFRFYLGGEAAIGLKAQFTDAARGVAALSLTSTKAGLTPGALLSSFDVGDVVELAGARIIPSTKSSTVTPGKGHYAQPGEIELHSGRLLFVTKPQSDGLARRVDLQSGDIGFSNGLTPVEIYSEWSIQDGTETVYEHKPTPPDPAESIMVAVA
jgi:hypothetical protein